MKYIIFLLLIISTINISNAQQTYTVSGIIKDAANGELLPGATIINTADIKSATVSNTKGFYSFTLPQGNYIIGISFIGYNEQTVSVNLNKNRTVNISLQSKTIETKEVTINGRRADKNIQSTEMGIVQLSVEKIKKLPAFMGEVDILKTIQLLPGVQSAGEGNSGYYVRGGGPDQNLILLDDATIFNASHLFGFFSVFNADAIDNVTFIKGGMPANYGGRLASVLDIAMKEGDANKYHVEGGIGVISSRLALQGPIKKNKSSFIVSARRTYIDALLKPVIDKSKAKGSSYYFYDVNAKINYILSEKDRLTISGYLDRDILAYQNSESDFNVKTPWGNTTASARWNHLFNDSLSTKTSIVFSDYNFSTSINQSGFEFKLFSGITDWQAKSDWIYYPSKKQEIKFGGNYIFHSFTPSSISAKSGNTELQPAKIKKQYANEAALYISDEYDLTKKIKITAGLGYSAFQHIGPYDHYNKDFSGNIVDTLNYSPGQNIKFYQGLEPRLAVRYSLNDKSSIKASYTHNYQYMHLTSFVAVSLPTDIWIPSSLLVKPQIGDLYALGYFRNFKENTYEASVEVYYKTMQNLVEYKENAMPGDNVNNNVEDNLTFGKGKSYGIEFFLKKTYGRLNGWLGYTLSYTTRTFPDINQGMEFHPRYDRRHDVSAVASYNLSKRWTFSAVFVYATGDATTPTIARYFIQQNLITEYGDRNSFRLPSYHRLDISFAYQGKKTEKYESSWNFSIYNVYNHQNPYFIYPNQTGSIATGDLKIQEKQVSLFPILPSISWNFKF
jgi:hypothetical protein